MDAQIAWRPLPAIRNFEIALVGHNLADEVVRNAASLNKDLVVMPGRNIRLVEMKTAATLSPASPFARRRTVR